MKKIERLEDVDFFETCQRIRSAVEDFQRGKESEAILFQVNVVDGMYVFSGTVLNRKEFNSFNKFMDTLKKAAKP